MNKSLLVILLTVTLDAAGIGLVIPILPSLLRELTGEVNVELHVGYFVAVYALMQFLFSPILGGLSDRFGRRPVLLISLVGAAIDYLVMAIAPDVGILYIGRVIAGITGANMAVATAYIADISNEDERAQRFGFMHAMMGLGFVAGPLIGSLVGSYFSLHAPFFVAAFLNAVTFCMALFLLPESHPVHARSHSASNFNPFTPLTFVFELKHILGLLAIYLGVHIVGQVPMTVWVVHGEDRYGWGPGMVGATFAGFGILHAIAQACLTGPVAKKLGQRGAVLAAIAFDASGFILMALAGQGWMVFPIMVFLSIGGIGMPALQALLSEQVPESKQGRLQGTLVSLVSMATIFGPLIASRVYGELKSHGHAGHIWYVAAGLYLLVLPAFFWWPRVKMIEGDPSEEDPSEEDPSEEVLVSADSIVAKAPHPALPPAEDVANPYRSPQA